MIFTFASERTVTENFPRRMVSGVEGAVETYRVLRADGAFDAPSLPADLVIDTGSRSATEAAQQIVEQLQISSSVDTQL